MEWIFIAGTFAGIPSHSIPLHKMPHNNIALSLIPVFDEYVAGCGCRAQYQWIHLCQWNDRNSSFCESYKRPDFVKEHFKPDTWLFESIFVWNATVRESYRPVPLSFSIWTQRARWEILPNQGGGEVEQCSPTESILSTLLGNVLYFHKCAVSALLHNFDAHKWR